jgi:hypothetical protein
VSEPRPIPVVSEPRPISVVETAPPEPVVEPAPEIPALDPVITPEIPVHVPEAAPPEPVLAELRAASPDVYDLLEERRQKAKAADWKDVQASWPQTRQEVLARGATKLP